MQKIAVFDFDKTITEKDSFNDFLIYTFGKRKFSFTILKKSAWIVLYKLKLISNAKVKTKLFQSFYKEKLYTKYKNDCNNYCNNRLNDIINEKIVNKIDELKKQNYKLVLLSASFKEWLEPWAKANGFTKVICSEFEINKDVIDGTILENKSCYGINKKNMLLKAFPNIEKNGYLIAYGDSKSDRFYMDMAQESYLIKKKEIIPINEYAIVTDGLWRKSVSAIRSLGKKNIKVIVTGDTLLSTGMWSRYCYKKEKISNVKDFPKKYEEKFLQIMKKCHRKPVIFPMEESTILWCSQNIDKIKDYCYILLPPLNSMEIALSKSLTVKAAQRIGINCPKTFFPKNSGELKKMIKESNLPDYVIKPYHGSGSAGLIYGSESSNIDLDDHWNKYGELILQERIPSNGEGVGVSIIMDKNHEVKGYFAHKRIEQYPNSGGPSTQRIGIKNPKLVEESIRLLKSLDWVGIAMVEWKYNPNTKEYVLMEINPRFWGSLELAVRSGVDFPYIYYQLAKGRYFNAITEYRTDYNCRWLLPGDVLRYITKKNRESLKEFCRGILKYSEEWDKNDKRGFFASIWCQGLLIINPKYWKYIRK